ncbi:beta C1 [Tomato leaf curl Sudan betasatellite]|uniref:C1 n=2 Tax=Tomato leaf curl Yemen betasatellite TaxID=1176156 RepID=A0A0S2PZN4_9VIRU|nr:beta C1 [Tomato leaf curl Yemen betasatellite]ALP06208.1 C1 [Tomato leaf curl Sudan betasatellite]AMK37723.1 beta C1 [Tomato leaf curl Sudan betasatellite]AMK37724.1 beta C1 [Tomato leaf curl Sudan betasatellite]AMK37725.1 beta C1 [Tomato leaf curl Sudan betasatellite]
MTINYRNSKGVEFKIEVHLITETVRCIIRVATTREPNMMNRRFIIPYSYDQIIAPFDFNGTEEEIKTALINRYRDTGYSAIREEDIVEIVDMVIAENTGLHGLQIIELYQFRQNFGV